MIVALKLELLPWRADALPFPTTRSASSKPVTGSAPPPASSASSAWAKNAARSPCLQIGLQFSVTVGVLWRPDESRADTASTSRCPLCTAARARLRKPTHRSNRATQYHIFHWIRLNVCPPETGLAHRVRYLKPGAGERQASRRRGPRHTPRACSGRGRPLQSGVRVGVWRSRAAAGPVGASESFTTVIVRSRYRRHPRPRPGSG